MKKFTFILGGLMIAGTIYAYSATLQFDTNGHAHTPDGFGIATSTPSAAFSIQAEGGEDVMSVGSSTAELFIISRYGKIGSGTTSPYRKLSVVGDAVFSGGDVLARTFTATSSVIFADGTTQTSSDKGTVFSLGRGGRCGIEPGYDTYLDANDCSDNEVNVGNIMPFSGKLMSFYVDPIFNEVDNITTFTVLKNGVPTSLTVTLASSTNEVISDTTHTVSVSAGDRIMVHAVSLGTPGPIIYLGFSYVLK